MAVCVVKLDSKHLISYYECDNSENRIGQYNVEHYLILSTIQMFLFEILVHGVHKNLNDVPS